MRPSLLTRTVDGAVLPVGGQIGVMIAMCMSGNVVVKIRSVEVERQKTHVKRYAFTPGILPYRNASTAIGIPVMTYTKHMNRPSPIKHECQIPYRKEPSAFLHCFVPSQQRNPVSPNQLLLASRLRSPSDSTSEVRMRSAVWVYGVV